MTRFYASAFLILTVSILNNAIAVTPSFSTWEAAETSTTLSFDNPRYITTSPSFTLNETTEITAFTYAQFSAEIYAVDRINAQLCIDYQGFRGYPLSFVDKDGSSTGVNRVTLPAGVYWIYSIPGQAVFEGYTNKIGYEVADVSLPGKRYLKSKFLIGDKESNGWQSKAFTIRNDQRAYLEAESTGGSFYIIKKKNYKRAFLNGLPAPESFWYVDTCNGGSEEMECELRLRKGDYWLVYINNTNDWNGFAAVIDFYKK
jgi:hypothetical protein